MSRSLKQDHSEIPALLRALKSLLKAKGLLYHDVAERLGVSETTIKRYLTGHSLTVEILEDICHVVDARLSDLLAISQEAIEQGALSLEMEQILVSDGLLAGVFYLLVRGLSPATVQRDFNLSDAEINGYLTTLDRLGLIRLFPYNRIRVLVGRNFNVQNGGPLAKLAYESMIKDFFTTFDVEARDWLFVFGKLSPSSLERVRELVRNFMDAFDDIAEGDRDLPLDLAKWYGALFMLRPVDLAGLRDWPPRSSDRAVDG